MSHRWSDLGRYRTRIRGARRVGAITGAGISVASGIQAYRGPGGLYDNPEEGERTVEALSAGTLARDPARTWSVVAALARTAIAARPSFGHQALVRIERLVDAFVLLSQNVDGLHALAGSENRIDIHGTLRVLRCMACGAKRDLKAADLDPSVDVPTCHACGGSMRPDAVLFGEMLDPGDLARVQAEMIDAPLDLLLVTGTSAAFPYIAAPVHAAAARGTLVVEFDPSETTLTPLATVSIRTGADEGLGWIADCMEHEGHA